MITIIKEIYFYSKYGNIIITANLRINSYICCRQSVSIGHSMRLMQNYSSMWFQLYNLLLRKYNGTVKESICLSINTILYHKCLLI